jgi:hypothetical protein
MNEFNWKVYRVTGNVGPTLNVWPKFRVVSVIRV